MSEADRKRKVFISHSGEDTWVARQIAKEITEKGGEPFLDEADVSIGAEFEEDILQFLETADELLVLMTPWALDRPYVWSEIGAAWFKRIPIIILLHGLSIQEFQSRPSVPVFLKKRDMIKLNDIDKYLTQFQRQL